MSSFDDKQSHTVQESEWGGRQSCFQKEVGKKNFILVGVDTFSFIYICKLSWESSLCHLFKTILLE